MTVTYNPKVNLTSFPNGFDDYWWFCQPSNVYLDYSIMVWDGLRAQWR
jgi:hypothetical protein